MIRVLTFVPLPRSSRAGGTEEYAYSVVDELRNAGFVVSVVTSGVNDSDAEFLESEIGYKTTHINSSFILQRPVPKLSSIPVLLRLIFQIKECDIVHIHMPYPFVEAYVSIIARLTGKKTIVTYHMDARIDSDSSHLDASPKSNKSLRNKMIEKAYFLISSRYPLRRASIICSNTKTYSHDSPVLTKFIAKVHVIYQGINQQLFNGIDNNRANYLRSNFLQDKNEFIVSFVGRLVPYKGIPILLDAIKIINESTGLKIHFVIGGIGKEKSRLVELSELLGLRNVSFIGYVEDSDLFNLYRASDVVVSPSISELESTPITLLSALTCGTPVIGTFVGGTAETIPNDGVRAEIVAPKNPRDLALSICNLLVANKNLKVSEKKPLIDLRFWSHVAADYGNLFSKNLKVGPVTTTHSLK